VKAVDRLGQSVVVAFADAADRRLDPGFGEALGIFDREILAAAVRVGGRGRSDERPARVNPICEDDVFTDRWPETIRQQDELAGYLKELVTGLKAAKRGNLSADQLMDWLRNRFGDRAVTKAADRMANEIGAGVQSADQRYTRKGGLLLPTAGIVPATASPSIVKAQPHSFYGYRI
jgi:hypothetical protein